MFRKLAAVNQGRRRITKLVHVAVGPVAARSRTRCITGTCRDLARNEEFSEIAVINIFFTVLKNKTQLSVGGGGGGFCGENCEISHAIDM